MNQRNKICPECHSEYLPHVSVCADCQTKLIWEPDHQADLPAGESKLSPPEQYVDDDIPVLRVPGDEELVKVFDGSEMIVKAIECQLTLLGVPCNRAPSFWVDQMGNLHQGRDVGGLCFTLGVRPCDEQQAAAVASRENLKANPALAEYQIKEIDGTDCPACGHPLPESCHECPDCGLAFNVEDQ